MKVVLFIVCILSLFLMISSAKDIDWPSKFIIFLIFFLGPNVKDLLGQAKYVKPLLEKPYIPTEVEKLIEKKKPSLESEMRTAEILSNMQQTDLLKEEKPTIYSTIIKSRPTSVMRPVPIQEKVVINTPVKIPGTFSIPVKIESNYNNPTLSGYTTPYFKGQRENSIETFLRNDIETISQEIKMGDRMRSLENAKERLIEEQITLKEQIQKEEEELDRMNSASVKIDYLLKKYENIRKK